MGENTEISWCDNTFNAWWGCTKVSPACDHCYAETWARRLGHSVWGADEPRRFFGQKHWDEPRRWNAKAEASGTRARVFCLSMGDINDPHPALGPHRERLWDLIEETPALDWLLLTKHPHRYRLTLPTEWLDTPRPNVWLGTTVESQEWAERRVEFLCSTPALMRFVSAEPLLGPVDLRNIRLRRSSGLEGCVLDALTGEVVDLETSCMADETGWIDWVIVGGESGHGARPMRLEWARGLRDQCVRAGTAFHFKQWGEMAPAGQLPDATWRQVDAMNPDVAAEPDTLVRVGKKLAGRELDGRTWDELPEVRS
jgi:protein gp37